MQKLIDKAVLLGLCLTILPGTQPQWMSVIALLAAVAVTSLCTYFENRIPSCLCILYVAVCVFVPELTVFMPLVAYDCAWLKQWFLRFCWVVALPAALIFSGPQIAAAIALISGTAFLLQYRTTYQTKTQNEYFLLMDVARERTVHLEHKNRELMEKQDYEVRLATLSERNRIAREIHDNVGHLLTRSILQLGALRVKKAGDPGLTGELDYVKDTLSDAMDSIRSSVHDLHDESVDLKIQLESMIEGFSFCPVCLRYDAGDLPVGMKYCFAAIVREALSNIAKHSNATEASVTLSEHPGFCRLVVEDNGSPVPNKEGRGIGLQNMADRVESLGGVFSVKRDKGFRLFISVPKESRQ